MMEAIYARSIRLLTSGEHIVVLNYPGLRIAARQHYRTWIYRYESPVDQRMWQVNPGHWPAMSFRVAVVEWEELQKLREQGVDLALQAQEDRKRVKAEKARKNGIQAYTVQRLCMDYWAGYSKTPRAPGDADEVKRMFSKMLGELAAVPVVDLKRSQAFDFIRQWSTKAPVHAKKIRSELGAAWEYAMDAGRLPESVPNWWRGILRGKIHSKGKKIAGKSIGMVKRILSAKEVGILLTWLPSFSPLIANVLILYLWTGIRDSEIVQVKGSEVTQEGDQYWMTIPKNKTKNARHENAIDLRGHFSVERLGEMLMQTFAFSPVPQMFRPALDIYANRDAFTGREIERMGMERLSKGLRAREIMTAAGHGLSAVNIYSATDQPVALSPV